MNKADVNCYKKKEKFLGRGNHSPQTATGAWWLVLFNTEPIFFSCRSRGSFLFGFPRCNVLWNCVGQQAAGKKLVLDWINIRCCNDITKWAQNKTQSQVIENCQNCISYFPKELMMDQQKNREMGQEKLNSSVPLMGFNWRGKKDVTFPSGRRVLLWHARKGLLLSTLCSAGPEWEFDFEFGALFSSLLLPNKLKLVSDPSTNQCGRNCAIKNRRECSNVQKKMKQTYNTTWRHIQESWPHSDLLEGDVVYVTESGVFKVSNHCYFKRQF